MTEQSTSEITRDEFFNHMKEWLSEAEALEKAHDRAQKKWRRIRDLFQVPIITLSAFTSFVFTLECQQTDDHIYDNMALWGLLASSCVTILSGLYNLYDPSDRARQHGDSSSRYHALYRDIEYNITMGYSEHLTYMDTFFLEISHEFSHLNAIAPDLSIRDAHGNGSQ